VHVRQVGSTAKPENKLLTSDSFIDLLEIGGGMLTAGYHKDIGFDFYLAGALGHCTVVHAVLPAQRNKTLVGCSAQRTTKVCARNACL
jgi:hypothetical protein